MVSRTKAADTFLTDIMVKSQQSNRLSFVNRQSGPHRTIRPGTVYSDYGPRGTLISHQQLIEIGKLYKLRPNGDRLLTVIISVYRECEELDQQLTPALTFDDTGRRPSIIQANRP